MWVTKLLISPGKIRIFCPKELNLTHNWHFCLLLAHLVPCWWVVGGGGARAVSRKTPIYFIFLPSIANFYRQSVVCLTPADGHRTERFDCPKKILHS